MPIHRLLPTAILAAALSAPAGAAVIEVSITNEQAADGFFLTPLVTALHDGTLDNFSPGQPASNFPGLEAIAEDGIPGPFVAANPGENITVIGNPGGFGGAPVIDPGETAAARIVVDVVTDRFLSFLSMVIPSNDSFIGNPDPMAYELFDMGGGFAGPLSIQIFGGQIWESGTETDDGQGAAFSQLGGISSDQNGVIRLAHPAGALDPFPGTLTAAGTQIGAVPGGDALIASITVNQIPVPAALPLLAAGLGALALLRRRSA